MSMVRWLQISDLHYGYDSYVALEMRRNMLESLPGVLPDTERPEYLFITGDLRYGKECKDRFPDEIAQDMKALMKAFEIPPERVHIVMGNHDAVRELGRERIAPLLRKEYADRSILNGDDMRSLELSQHKFYDVYRSICGREPAPYHQLVEEPGFNIICLNTAFACSDDQDDGNLLVGMKLVQDTLRDIDASKPGIVLAHHGFESLQKTEREQLELKLKRSGALLYLCGHEHMANSQKIAIQREQEPICQYTCGTGMDRLPNGQSAEMAVFMGELDTEKGSGCIRGWEWVARYEGWMECRGLSYKQTGLSDGRHYFPAAPPQMTVTPAAREEALAKYKDYILFECNEIRLDGMPANDKKTLALEELFIPTKFARENRVDGGSTWFEFKYRLAKMNERPGMESITGLLDQMEKGEWNQYTENHVAILNDTIDDIIRLQPDTQFSALKARIQRLADDLREKNSLIPLHETGFRRVILAGPGGGKTTLLKRLATAYAFPQRRANPEIDDRLPSRALLPIWIRCRDLKDKADLSLNEIIQSVPLRANFRPDRPELAAAFLAEVFKRMSKGEVLLLIDGLDEIADGGLRIRFAEELARFAQLNPKANMIVTSRIAGFEHVSSGKLGKFPRALIAELDSADIRLLCRRWHRVIYDGWEDYARQADALADTILKYDKIRNLASSPLLLTTLLLVQRREGRLPTKRFVLYRDSVKVLLETWNQAAWEPLDMETAMCQLSYVAFEMMRVGIQTIGKKDLERLLRKVRKEQTWLPSSLEAPGKFLERVELRSSLLAKRGYRRTDAGILEEEYEFQHLTFQEYLAAYAVVEGYYAGVDQQDSYVDVLENFYSDSNKEEVVLLAAALANRKSVSLIVKAIIAKAEEIDLKKKDVYDGVISLRNLLMKLVLDEVQLVEATRNQIFETVLKDSLSFRQVSHFREVLDSGFGKEFQAALSASKWRGLASAFDIQKNGQDPIAKCVDLIKEGIDDPEKRNDALRIFDYLLWLVWNDIQKVHHELVNSVYSLLGDIIVSSDDGQSIRASAACLYWFWSNRQPGVDPTSIPEKFTSPIIKAICEKEEIGTAIRLFEEIPIVPENAKKLLCLDCPQEHKQFLLGKFPDASYFNKQGNYLAAVLAGAWSWDEAEAVLEEAFADEEDEDYNKMKEKLHILREAAEGNA